MRLSISAFLAHPQCPHVHLIVNAFLILLACFSLSRSIGGCGWGGPLITSSFLLCTSIFDHLQVSLWPQTSNARKEGLH